MGPRLLTPTRKAQLTFWTGFRDYALTHAKRFRPAKPAATSWMHLGMGRAGFHLRANAIKIGGGAIRIDFVITEENPHRFHQLHTRSDEIASELGITEPIEWYGDGNRQQRGFRIRTAAEWWEEGNRAWCYGWLVATLDRCSYVLEPRITSMARGDGRDQPGGPAPFGRSVRGS